jgi:Branched-chain amino acid ABC-type transport system, permease components
MNFINDIIDGLRSGSIYALIALAFSLGANICGIINFVNGEIFMISIYIIAFCYGLKIPLILSVIISMIICALFNVTIEKYIYRPFYKHPKITGLIVSIGMAFLIQNIFVLFFSSDPINIGNTISGQFKFGALEIEYTVLISILIAFSLMIATYGILKYTKIGKIIRAVCENYESTTLMGIDADKIISLVFAICAVLLVCSGCLFYLSFPIANPYIGTMIGLRALAASIIGGLGLIQGSILTCVSGAVISGFLIGIIETVVKSYISVQLSDVVIFAFLAIFLLVNHKKYK